MSNREKNLLSMRSAMDRAKDFDVTVKIEGSFLVANNLQEVWNEMRGFNGKYVIDNDFTDTISIYQAQTLGIIEKL